MAIWQSAVESMVIDRMEALPLALPGCYVLRGRTISDERGTFFKIFNGAALAGFGLESVFSESFVTSSHRGVVRGMHLQLPPSDQAKLVCCLSGRVRDGLLDLRRWSPTFGQAVTIDLTAGDDMVVYIPRGVAHGFAAWENDTRMWYLVSSPHDPERDGGVRWDSAGIEWWPEAERPSHVVVSARDLALPPLVSFDSPFDVRREM